MRKRSFVAVAFAALLAVGLFGLAGCTESGTYQPELVRRGGAPGHRRGGAPCAWASTPRTRLWPVWCGKIIGIDVDIAAALADELGLAVGGGWAATGWGTPTAR